MCTKYGEVDTSVKDIDILHKEIDKKREDIRHHNRLSPSGNSRCKKVEDDYNNRSDELRTELKILDELYKKVVIIELNKFPTNKPCTIEYISDYIGVKSVSVMWDTFMESDTYLLVDRIHVYRDTDNHNVTINVISECEIEVAIVHFDDYLGGWDAGDICRMKLPNWRFVASTDSHIVYVERL
jgi:hypothetical protein